MTLLGSGAGVSRRCTHLLVYLNTLLERSRIVSDPSFHSFHPHHFLETAE